jgi:hypothetical protein
MRSKRVLLLVALAGAVLAANAPAQNRSAATRPARPSRADFERQYNVVIDNNIFLRERGRTYSPPVRREPDTQPATAPAPGEEQTYALRGVVFEGDDLRAYFENLGDNTIVRVEPGDAIARGRVIEISVDAVAYESGGELTWIEIGHDLTGTARVAATQPSGVGGATQPASGGDPRTQSVEEMMRQRRQRFINR